MVENGQLPGLNGFLVSAPTAHAPEVVIDGENVKDKKDLKGKGWANEKSDRHQSVGAEMLIAVNVEDRMHDVTNTSSGDQAQPCVFEPPGLLGRQPTTIIPQPESFGLAQRVLGQSSSFIPHPSSICTPARSMVSSVVQFPNNNEPYTVRSTFNVESFNANDLNLDLGPLSFSHRPSQRSVDSMSWMAGEGDHQIRVPSSTSPSPMKSLHRNGRGDESVAGEHHIAAREETWSRRRGVGGRS